MSVEDERGFNREERVSGPPVTITKRTEVTLNNFRVPEYITHSDGGFTYLKNLDVETLSKLCDNFRKKVFEIAGKRDTPIKKEEKTYNKLNSAYDLSSLLSTR